MDRLACVDVPAAPRILDIPALTERLQRFTPHIEPKSDEPGVFWLDASGLQRIYPALAAWARGIRNDLAGDGMDAAVVVGFRRFACYAVARTRPKNRVVVFTDPAAEEIAALQVPLACIGLDDKARETLNKLAVRTLGEFLRLPESGILRRFGSDAHRLHRMAAGKIWHPLQPQAARVIDEARLHLDEPENDLDSLSFLIKQLLDPLLVRLAARGEALVEIVVRLWLDRPGGTPDTREERVRPAAPTRDGVQILGLVRLRLETLAPAGGVTAVEIAVSGVRTVPQPLALTVHKPRRDLEAAARAFARLRAIFGADAVARARLHNGHLPEARFVWEPLPHIVESRPHSVLPRTLIRRLYAQPIALPFRPPREPDGWLLRGPLHGLVEQLRGPYLLSGGWWRKEIERDYYFADLQAENWQWIYYDRPRRRWFLHGDVA